MTENGQSEGDIVPYPIPFCILPVVNQNGTAYAFKRAYINRLELIACIGAIPFIVMTALFFRQAIVAVPAAVFANIFLLYRLVVQLRKYGQFEYVVFGKQGAIEAGIQHGRQRFSRRSGRISDVVIEGGLCAVTGAKSIAGRKKYPVLVWLLRLPDGTRQFLCATETESDFNEYRRLLPANVVIQMNSNLGSLAGDFRLRHLQGIEKIKI